MKINFFDSTTPVETEITLRLVQEGGEKYLAVVDERGEIAHRGRLIHITEENGKLVLVGMGGINPKFPIKTNPGGKTYVREEEF